MKKLLVLAAMLAALLVMSSPASAQEVTLDFELTVEGEPPADATFWGQYLVEGATIPLEDPDGDGVYTGSMSGGQPAEGAGVRIVQGTGTEKLMTGLYPGEPITVIKDFGAPEVEGDKTFSASVSFDESSTTGDQYATEPVAANNSEGPDMLPNTGGTSLPALGALALLLAGVGRLLSRSLVR